MLDLTWRLVSGPKAWETVSSLAGGIVDGLGNDVKCPDSNDRVSDADADRQQQTAVEILRRLADQPGLVLADEVGMGKTCVLEQVAARRRAVIGWAS
jgi:hypothetical protein